MPFLNYHHLRYFHTIAAEGTLQAAAGRLNLSPSALSIQLRKLEDSLGHPLFHREGKSLVLTEAGHIVRGYADTIFRSGDELLATLTQGALVGQQVLRIGAVATHSRNFQLNLLRPLMNRPELELVLRSGSFQELLGQLEAHTLDLVLSNQPVRRDVHSHWRCQLLEEQPVSLVGRPFPQGKRKKPFPEVLRETPVIVPSLESSLRAGFDQLMDQAGIRPTVAAEVDDMAMLRLLARESEALALVPPIVVQDELEAGILREHYQLPELVECFYAITPRRRFRNKWIERLLAAPGVTKQLGD
jgi:LysR family transcriptional activator of nhaA